MAMPATKLDLYSNADTQIKPKCLVWEWQGTTRRAATIHLPPGIEFKDLSERPQIFAPIQQSASPLQFLDELMIVASDQSWIVRAVVDYSDNEIVSLSEIKRAELGKRYSIAETDTHRIRYIFSGERQKHGFCVVRKRDNEIVAGPFNQAVMAQSAMPKPAQAVK